MQINFKYVESDSGKIHIRLEDIGASLCGLDAQDMHPSFGSPCSKCLEKFNEILETFQPEKHDFIGFADYYCGGAELQTLQQFQQFKEKLKKKAGV